MSILDKYECEGQMSLFDLADGWCGRMSVEHSQVTVEKISESFSKKQQKFVKGMPLFLDLRVGNGHTPDVSFQTDGHSLGAYMTANGGEFHSVESESAYWLTLTDRTQGKFCLNCSEKPMAVIESRLSWILEPNPDPKYNLSQKACLGILRRAENRGKVLPEMLDRALRKQADLSVSKNEPENQGGGKGIAVRPYGYGGKQRANGYGVL